MKKDWYAAGDKKTAQISSHSLGIPLPPVMSGMRPKTWLGARMDSKRRTKGWDFAIVGGLGFGVSYLNLNV